MKIQLTRPSTAMLLDLMEDRARLTFKQNGNVQVEIYDPKPEEKEKPCKKEASETR